MINKTLVTPSANWIQTGSNEKVQIIKEDDHELMNENVKPTETSNISKFVDLFWFYTFKDESDLKKNELSLISLAFNINFGNIRFNGFQHITSYIHNQALFLPSNAIVVNSTLYPTGIYFLRHLKNGQSYKPIEQLFVDYDPINNPWQDNLVPLEIKKNNDRLLMTFQKKDEAYYFYFTKEQVGMLNLACDNVLCNGMEIVSFNKK